jgi:carbon monoxide dehydrogenase subunit G
MQLSGKYSLNTDRVTIWNLLMNPEILALLIPGITRLERKGEHNFISIMEIKMGPINGSFTGTMDLEQITEYESFTLNARQDSKMGKAQAVIKIDFSSPSDNQTELAYNGDIRLTGLLANMGQRLIGGVATTLIKQFFSNLTKELEKQSAA